MVRAVDVADVLSTLEYPEGEARQEVSRRQETSGRSESESGALLEKIADFL